MEAALISVGGTDRCRLRARATTATQRGHTTTGTRSWRARASLRETTLTRNIVCWSIVISLESAKTPALSMGNTHTHTQTDAHKQAEARPP